MLEKKEKCEAVIVRLYIDLEYAIGGVGDNVIISDECGSKRISFDKFYFIDDKGKQKISDLEQEAQLFCFYAMRNGISFVDKKNKATRYIPSRNVITAFQRISNTVDIECKSVEESLELNILTMIYV